MSFETYLQNQKNLDSNITSGNNNNPEELKTPENPNEEQVEVKPVSNPVKPKSSVYEVFNPQGFNYKGLTLEDASNNSTEIGKYIDSDGNLADLDMSGFRTMDGKNFGANGLVYVRPQAGNATVGIMEATQGTVLEGSWAEYLGKAAGAWMDQYDPETVLRVLVPGINPENGQPILKEVVGTRKDLEDREIAVSQAYGFQNEEDGFLASFNKAVLNTLSQTDEVLAGAASMLNPTNAGLKEAHMKAIEKNKLYGYIPSEESEDAFTWDWFASGLGNAMASQAQFGTFGKVAGTVTSQALRLGGRKVFMDYGKRKIAENLASWTASGIIGTGYAMSEARKAGLSDWEAWTYAATVGGINSVIEKKLNVDFDRGLMGGSTQYIARTLLRELNGDFSSQNINRAARVVLASAVTGGKSMLKAAGTEGLEEVLQTGVEQSGRMIHEALVGSDREKNEGRFEDAKFHWEEILEAGFFGMAASYPTMVGGAIKQSRSDESYMDRMIREGKGDLILGAIDDLHNQGKISPEKFREIKRDARIKVAAFDDNQEAFFNLRGFKNSRIMERDLQGLFRRKADYQIRNEELLAELGTDPEATPSVSKEKAEEVRKEIAKVDAKMKDVQTQIDKYKSRAFVESENSRYEQEKENYRRDSAEVFSQLSSPDVAADSFDEIVDRYTALDEAERNATPFVRNATEAKMVVEAIQNGKAAEKLGDIDQDAFLESMRLQLEVTKMHLHPSVNTDANRATLLEMGFDETQLPLTESERQRAQTNPEEFAGRTLVPGQIESIMASTEFQDALNGVLTRHFGEEINEVPESERLNFAWQELARNGSKYGITDAMLHSANEMNQLLDLLGESGYQEAFKEMVDKSDKAVTFVSSSTDGKTNGFHYAPNGMIALLFNKERMAELRAKEMANTLTSRERDELSVLRRDLFHKLTHETTHNLFDYQVIRLEYAYRKYQQSGKKTPEAMLFQRFMDLAQLSYYALENHPKAKRLYFFRGVAKPILESGSHLVGNDAGTLVKEFFAEAMSNPEFQELLDGFDFAAKKNKKYVDRHYRYESINEGFGKSLLREIVDAFHGVVDSIKRVLSQRNRTLLTEAMVLGSQISTNRHGKDRVEDTPFVGNMDISMYNPKLLIDNEDEFIHVDALAFSISQRLADEGFFMTDQDYNDFSERMAQFVADEITGDIERQTLKVVYFQTTDSFLITYKTANGQSVATKRQFFNRFGRKESINTNVLNGEKGNSLKKPYGFEKLFDPRLDNDGKASDERKIVDNFLAAEREGFAGDISLQLNEEKEFGTREKKYRGEIEVLYTFADGSQRVIGFAPDLAKPRLAKMLSLGASIPVKVETDGPGSRAFVLYNEPGNPESGVKRVLNPRDYNNQLTDQLIEDGYVSVKGFMPKSLFKFDVANVKVEPRVLEVAEVQDTLTVDDENLDIDWSSIKRLSDKNFVNHEFDQGIADSVLGEGFSFYLDLDTRVPFDKKTWFYRDFIRKNIRYKAMTGLYNGTQLDHGISAMVSAASQELKQVEGNTEIQNERAERLGFQTEEEMLQFIADMVSSEAMEAYRQESSTGIKQDWDGHGLNPNETIFTMVCAQVESLTFLNPASGQKEMLTLDKSREVLFTASREGKTFKGMIGKLLELQKDPKLNETQKAVAKSLYDFYSSPVTDKAVIERISEMTGVSERLLAEISEYAASKATGDKSFKAAINSLVESGEMVYPDGSGSSFSKDQVIDGATQLASYYANPNASVNGLVKYFGSNSLYTAFASMRKVDSISLIPTAYGTAILSFNGKKKVKDEAIAENEVKIRRVLQEISSEHKLVENAREALYNRIRQKYEELGFGEFPKEALKGGKVTLDKFLYRQQFFAHPQALGSKIDANGKWMNGQGINDHWMQQVSKEDYNKMARVLKAFYATFDIDVPNGLFWRSTRYNNEFFKDWENTADMEFLESMAEENIQEGTDEYAKALVAHQQSKAKIKERMLSENYTYPTSKFGRKTGSYSSDFNTHPTMALLLQGAYYLNSSASTFFAGEIDTEIMGDEMKKLSEEQVMFGRINQSDEMYFDPKGNKRFSVKIKSQADTLMEDLSMNKDGILNELSSSPEWEHNTVLQKIKNEKGRPIDVLISGLRTWRKGSVYSESTDLDFVYMNMAAFTSRYDYSTEYIHVDDIPSDKPTIYGYRLERLERAQMLSEIENISTSERRKRLAAKKLLSQAFTPAIFHKNGKGADIADMAVFDTLVEGIHYTVKDGKYFQGKIMDSSKSYFGGDKKASEVMATVRAEANKLYEKLSRQGVNIPLNANFIKENDPAVILERLEKRLFRLETTLDTFPESTKASEWMKEINALRPDIEKKRQTLKSDKNAYLAKAEERKKELFVEEFYPNFVINRYHLSRLLMGDAVFYKNVFDMNKRKAGPAAPFYKGSWSRPTANLIALDDVGDRGDKTFAGLPSVTFDEDTNEWKIVENANTIETARTDAQGYVTEQFAQEMVDAYGAFSGFKKIFKPVMFGVNRQFLKRGQPLYMKLSVAIIPDPANPANAAHFEKYPNQLEFARKFYASKGDIALFKSGVKVGYKNNSKIDDETYKVQEFDLDKFGLQNDPEKSVEDDNSEIAGGVQLHKQLADNGNFQEMLGYYALEAEILRARKDRSFENGTLSSMEKIRDEFVSQLEGKSHTAELGGWVRSQDLELFDHPFTSEAVQNMTQSFFNKLGTLLKKKGKKLVNMSDLGFDHITPSEKEIQEARAFMEEGFNADGYTPKWAGPRRVTDLHPMDLALFNMKVKDGEWVEDELNGFIFDTEGKPVIFPADVLVPENSNIKLGSRMINTRIPTTGKGSNIPSRVVGYLPAELGNVIVTPKEGPGILGFDFDVDGLFAWTDGSGDKDMDTLFDFAFKVLSDAKNYNELTSPVGTDLLKGSANFFSVSEQEAEKAFNDGDIVEKGDLNPNGWLDYGFARQLEMMKMNSIGKVFIGTSASFSAIYSVFSQTETSLQSNMIISRAYNIEGARTDYPSTDTNGNRITDVFVQLINAATDNVKEMLLARNNINLVTGDVMMDMVAHGIPLNTALLFINQPSVRDLVKLHDRNDSVSIDQDFLSPEDRLMETYTRVLKRLNLVDAKYKYKPRIYEEKSIVDRIPLSEDKLREMYFAGNKKMGIEEVSTIEDLISFFGNKVDPNGDVASQLKNLMEDQMVILEKFKFYKSLASVTRQGGALVMMFSKNPKNYIELKNINDRIDKAFGLIDGNAKLSDYVTRNHPSYRFMLSLLKDNLRFYEDNLLVAHPLLDQEIFSPLAESMGSSQLEAIHKEFMTSLVMESLSDDGIRSDVLTGSEISSLEFNEIFVRLLNENRDLFADNKFMQQLAFDLSDMDITDLSKGRGKISEISFNGTKQFSEIELAEIQDSFYDIPNLEYNGHEVNTKAALVYYLAITKGFGLGGYSFSKILPQPKNNTRTVLGDINNYIKDFKEELNYIHENILTREKNEEAGMIEWDGSSEQLDLSALDPYLLHPVNQFEKTFKLRNDHLKPEIHRSEFNSLMAKSSKHFDNWLNQVDPNAKYFGPLKMTEDQGSMVLSIATYNTHSSDFQSFLANAYKKGGFVLIDQNGEKRVFVYRGSNRQEVNNQNWTQSEFVEKKVKSIQGLYEPKLLDRNPQVFFRKQKEHSRAVDISGSAIHSTETNPNLLAYFEKDKAKFAKATQLISRGTEASSSNSYANAANPDVVNTGKYTSNDVVGISAEGNREGRISPDYALIQAAMDAGAKIITDNALDRERGHNIGEREVANYLSQNGYVETQNGLWERDPAFTPWSERVVDLDQDVSNLENAVKNQSVVVTQNEAIVEFLLQQGYQATRVNPHVYYFKTRNVESYTKEQIKTLRNKC